MVIRCVGDTVDGEYVDELDYFICDGQDRSGFPIIVSGVPPDAFSETGQLWDRYYILSK